MTSPKLNDYLKITQAAGILGRSQSTVRVWAVAGKIRGHRNPASRYRLFLPRDVLRFLAKVVRPAKG
jgi:DNA-binding transcriptional MerR regulator